MNTQLEEQLKKSKKNYPIRMTFRTTNDMEKQISNITRSTGADVSEVIRSLINEGLKSSNK